MIRLLTIFLLFIHTFTQAGTVLSAHYCMGDLAGVSWGEEKHPGCSFCGMKTKSCCHDDVKIIKSDDLAFSSNSINPGPQYLPLSVCYSIISLPNYSQASTFKYVQSNLIFSEGPPLYLKNCVFRI